MKQVLVKATLSFDADLLGVRSISGGGREWVTTAEAAAALGVSGRHIRRLCIKGELRSRRVGKLYRVHVSELSKEEMPKAVSPEPPTAAPSQSEPVRSGVNMPNRPSSQRATSAYRTREEACASAALRKIRIRP